MELSGHLLTVLVFFPAAGVIALFCLRGKDEMGIRWVTFAISVAEFVFSLFLLRIAPFGTHTASRSNSSASSGFVSLSDGCGQSLPHTRRSGASFT